MFYICSFLLVINPYFIGYPENMTFLSGAPKFILARASGFLLYFTRHLHYPFISD